MKRLLVSVATAAAMIAASGCASVSQVPGAQSASVPVRVVYHMTLGLDEAQRGLGNIRNHLAADPTARIVVVGNGNGIEFMLDGAKDRNGNPFEVSIQELKSKGVEFRLCNNTLVQRKIDRARAIVEVDIVPSGVAEAARLQAREGFVYLRP